MASPLADLDELVLRCRDERAKAYIAEAVASYKGGAYRAAIVGAWIAVCFDVIEKLRELALAGDAEAERLMEELEETRKANDVVRALRFEKTILETARDTFELISHLEFIDLQRLQEDRNRCAHPSLVSEEQAYSPSAELARAHIHASVTHLLQHPPAQGKYALERLMNEVSSEYFPANSQGAVMAFSAGPLKKPRESLVRNFLVVLIKRLLQDAVDHKDRNKVSAAVLAVKAMHGATYAETLSKKLSPLVRLLPDEKLERGIYLLMNIEDCWEYLDVDIRLRVENFVKRLPSTEITRLQILLEYEPLRLAAESRVSWASYEELTSDIFVTMPAKLIDRFLVLLARTKSVQEANDLIGQLKWEAATFSAEQVRHIFDRVLPNRWVSASSEFRLLIRAVREEGPVPSKEFDELLAEHQLHDILS
jgi:hypothetical protein